MRPRGSVVPVLADGVGGVVKLLVATLAFAGVYLGVWGAPGAQAPVRASAEETARGPVRLVVLSSRAAPTGAAANAVAGGRAPAAGTIAVDEGGALGPCDSPYLARTLVANDDPRATVSYAWRLERWSSATRRWHTYLNAGAGFTGEGQVVEWRPRIVGNPGWYRVVLSVQDERPLRSERFLVTC